MHSLNVQGNPRVHGAQGADRHYACTGTRVQIMVSLGQVFTRGQVADLLARAFAVAQTAAWADGFLAGQIEAGERHMDALSVALHAPPFREIGHRRDIYKLDARREADIAGSYPWRTDYPGGPVPAW